SQGAASPGLGRILRASGSRLEGRPCDPHSSSGIRRTTRRHHASRSSTDPSKGGKVTVRLFPCQPTYPLVLAKNLHPPLIWLRQFTRRRFNSWACPSGVQGSVYFTGFPNLISQLGNSGSSRLASIHAEPPQDEPSSNLLLQSGQMRTTLGSSL